MTKTALIIGGGPAGLTYALELLRRTDIKPIVFESTDGVGGISRTFNHHGNRIDIGGHRFFSKSDRVMDWWTGILPIQGPAGGASIRITYQNRSRRLETAPDGPDPEKIDDVMLVRPRKSRILFRRKLFDYPISLSPDTLVKLGPVSTARIGMSYLRSRSFQINPENTLEEFFINRFGRELYATFFRDYTEKVWGMPCSAISAEWGAQRIKGLSLTATIAHALRKLVPSPGRKVAVETSLIEQFLYPKFGPGQMWEKVTSLITAKGGKVLLNQRVVGIETEGERVRAVRVFSGNGEQTFLGEYFASTMPVRDLIRSLSPVAPAAVRDVADGLIYRDFITVGLLLKKLRLGGECSGRELADKMSDNWIYVQEPDVKVGRLQFFNNWSPYMVADPDTIWLGLEYFCNEGDELWRMDDGALSRFAAEEIDRIGVIHATDVIDHTIVRIPKAYPAYFGTFDRFGVIRQYVDRFVNLTLLGRNGMHRYNNQDHSMLSAMVAVDNIVSGQAGKDNIWLVNTEADYHEEK